MTKMDQDKAFETLLSANLARVNDFLKFAETKNAALVTFCSAWIIATFNLMAFDRYKAPVCKTEFAFALASFAIACGICCFAFLPQLRNSSANHDAEKQNSILFFDKIAGMDVTLFCQELKNGYRSTDENLFSKRYLNDLMHQMHSNSHIARRKFTLFKFATPFAGVGIVLVAVPIIVTAWHSV